MLIVFFTNIKLKRLFSRTNRVKTDLRNQLSHNCPEVCLRIGEARVAVDAFNPDPVGIMAFQLSLLLEIWPNKPTKYVNTGASSEENYIDLDEFTMSNLENSDNKFQGL